MTMETEAAAKRAAELIRELALEFGDDSYEFTIWKAAKFYLHNGPAGRKRETDDPEDGAPKWAARLMLFDPSDVLVADSQDEQDLDEWPNAQLPTLRAVGAWAREAAEDYHAGMRQAAPVGLDAPTLERRMLVARVAIHRHKGGLAWWKLPYTVGGKQWHAHVRLGRLTEEQVAAALKPKSSFRREVPPPASSEPSPPTS